MIIIKYDKTSKPTSKVIQRNHQLIKNLHSILKSEGGLSTTAKALGSSYFPKYIYFLINVLYSRVKHITVEYYELSCDISSLLSRSTSDLALRT